MHASENEAYIEVLARAHLDRVERRALGGARAAALRVLCDGEEPVALAGAFLDGLGLLFVTDERALFILEDGTLLHRWALDDIGQVAVTGGANHLDLEITVAGHMHLFEDVGEARTARALVMALAGEDEDEDDAAELLGSCPACAATWDPPLPAGSQCPACRLVSVDQPVQADAPAPDIAAPALPAGVGDSFAGRRRCPFCAEEIHVAAVLCRHCGSQLLPGAAGPRSGESPPTSNGLAIASLVLGILWLYWIGSILALVFGYIARNQINESRGRQSGAGMATAGIVLGWVGAGVLALIVAFGGAAVFL